METWVYLCTQKLILEELEMIQNIIVGALFAAMIGAGVFGWWLETGKAKPKEKKQGERESDKE